MTGSYPWRLALALAAVVWLANGLAEAQSIAGTVVGPATAVVPNAKVGIHNRVSRYDQSTIPDAAGKFSFPNVPQNPYQLSVTAAGFARYLQDIDIASSVPTEIPIKPAVEASTTSVTVEAVGELVEDHPFSHTDVDKSPFDKLPLDCQSSLSSLVTFRLKGLIP
jgi:Carboxypeptidase regulatory-like domain